MYPKDNVFQICYNIGKRLPFQVKRSPRGLKGSRDEEYRYSQEGRTFMVERVEIRNKIYGTAYGYLMIDGIRDDDNEYMKGYEKGTVPCAGCGEWVLVDVPGVDMNDIFPPHKPDFVLPFGKHQGKTIAEIYKEDPKYVFWLAESDRYFRIDFAALTGIDPKDEQAQAKFEAEVDRVFPKTTIDNIINFGKYRGQTYKNICDIDPNYVLWVLQNNHSIDFDYNSFNEYFSSKIQEPKNE